MNFHGVPPCFGCCTGRAIKFVGQRLQLIGFVANLDRQIYMERFRIKFVNLVGVEFRQGIDFGHENRPGHFKLAELGFANSSRQSDLGFVRSFLVQFPDAVSQGSIKIWPRLVEFGKCFYQGENERFWQVGTFRDSSIFRANQFDRLFGQFDVLRDRAAIALNNQLHRTARSGFSQHSVQVFGRRDGLTIKRQEDVVDANARIVI